MERFFENAMYASRLLALWFILVSPGVGRPDDQVLPGDISVLPNIFSVAEADLILVLLSLVDMTLVGVTGDGDVLRL